jgi:hypothetical protein
MGLTGYPIWITRPGERYEERGPSVNAEQDDGALIE